MKQTGCDGVVPYCLGAARIEAGGNYPVESENSSHRREQPLASCSSPNEFGLITGRLLLSVLLTVGTIRLVKRLSLRVLTFSDNSDNFLHVCLERDEGRQQNFRIL